MTSKRFKIENDRVCDTRTNMRYCSPAALVDLLNGMNDDAELLEIRLKNGGHDFPHECRCTSYEVGSSGPIPEPCDPCKDVGPFVRLRPREKPPRDPFVFEPFSLDEEKSSLRYWGSSIMASDIETAFEKIEKAIRRLQAL